VLGISGIVLPATEPAILASVFVLGLMTASAARMPVSVGAALIGVFAVMHGNAHGVEAPENASGGLYMLGFTLSTVTLHVIGITAGLAARNIHRPNAVRFAGGVAALLGGVLFFS
jgi:urease accessory protein